MTEETVHKVRSEACSSCSMRGCCHVDDSQPTNWKAVSLGYLVPIVLLLGSVLAGDWTGIGENLTALITLGVLGVYYGVLWTINHVRRTDKPCTKDGCTMYEGK